MKKFIILMSLFLTTGSAFAYDNDSWRVVTFEDAMDGTVTKELRIGGITNKTLAFPYTDPTVFLTYGCTNKKFSLYTTANNLSGGDNHDGYTTHNIRIKIDDNLSKGWLDQMWGSNWFHVKNSIHNRDMKSSNKVLIETSLHGDGDVVYIFNTTGISDFITNCEDK
jgi:hypothetical protein